MFKKGARGQNSGAGLTTYDTLVNPNWEHKFE